MNKHFSKRTIMKKLFLKESLIVIILLLNDEAFCGENNTKKNKNGQNMVL